MKVLGYMSLHYGQEYLRESLLSIKDHVDKFYVIYSKEPSFGFSTAAVCPDKEEDMRQVAQEVLGDKLIWESFQRFASEGQHLDQHYHHCVGMDLAIKIDADEIFDNVEQALAFALAGTARFYHTPHYKHFWRTFDWINTDRHCPRRIEKLTANNLDEDHVLPLAVYHFGWAQNLKTIKYKLLTFGHKAELKENFLRDKYLAWTPETWDRVTYLHPVSEEIWGRPHPFNKELLPPYLKHHPRFNAGPETDDTRVLLIPMSWGQHEKDEGLFGDMLKSFQVLYSTMIYQGDLQQAIGFKPTLVLFQADMPEQDLRELKKASGAIIAMYSGDACYTPADSLVEYKEVVDAYLLPFRGETLKTYQGLLGRPCHFLWEFIQGWRYIPNLHLQEGDTVFVGRDYRHLPGQRHETLQYLQENAGLIWWGNVQEISNKDVPKAYNDAFIVVCENNHCDLQDYFTPRNLGAMAAGSCALMRHFPGIENHFQHLTHCIVYHNKYQALEWIKYLKKNPSFRNHIAEHGFKLAWDKFKMNNWVSTVMGTLQEKHLL